MIVAVFFFWAETWLLLAKFQNGVQMVIDENPDLKWWFDKVEESATKLVESAKKCEALTGFEQKFVLQSNSPAFV